MEIKDVKEQKTLMIRTTAAADRLPLVMGESFREIASYMERRGLGIAGPPYAMYYNMDMEALDLEMGFPVDDPVAAGDEGEGRIKTGFLPGGKVATILHSGPYDRLEESYTKLMAFVKEKGIEVHEHMYESYLNSPLEVKPEELQTQICFILK